MVVYQYQIAFLKFFSHVFSKRGDNLTVLQDMNQAISTFPVGSTPFKKTILSFHFNWLLTGEVHLAVINFPYTTLFTLLLLENSAKKESDVTGSLDSLPEKLQL